MPHFEDFLCERGDNIDNAVYDLILMLTGKTDEELPWSMELIGDVTDAIEEVLKEKGYSVCRPFYDEDERPCYCGTDCIHGKCPFKDKEEKK